MRHTVLVGVAVFGVGTFALLGTHSAQAEVSDQLSKAVVNTALQNMGTESLSEDLSARLAREFSVAMAAGLVNQEIIDAVSSTLHVANGAASSGELPETTAELFAAHLEVDQRLWDAVSTDWVQAFETIRAEYEACCDAGTGKSECTRTFGQQLQRAHSDVRGETTVTSNGSEN